MVIIDSYELILSNLGFKKINGVFTHSKYKIMGKFLFNNNYIVFHFEGKHERVKTDSNFRDNICNILNSCLKSKLHTILNKIKSQ